jgi:HK97 family phage portal protein
LRYKIYNGNRTEILLQEEVFHVRNHPGRDPALGVSPIAEARGSLQLALDQETTAGTLARQGLRSSGMVSYPQALSKDQRGSIASAFEEHQGPTNAGRVLVFDGGAQFTALTFTPTDAQFLESRKLSNEDVARIFGIPPTCAGLVDKATYSNTEQEARALVQNALAPLANRVEAAISRCLLTEVSRRNLYAEHDLDGLLRGDVKSRFEAYRIAREVGVMSVNDIRKLENQPPVADGDGYSEPANWKPLGAPPVASLPSEA